MNVILLAGGIGTRAKLNYPKQFMRLGGKPLIIHSIELFNSFQFTDKIIISVIPGERENFESVLEKYCYGNCVCVDGGSTRQESVYNALKHCTTKRVLIHETVRPFVSVDLLQRLVTEKGDCVMPCIPVTSTVFYKDSYLERSEVLCVQLPQIFDTEKLKTAHELGKGKNYTDDSSLIFNELGVQPTVIEGLDENIKITTPLDTKIAEVIYNETCGCDWRE